MSRLEFGFQEAIDEIDALDKILGSYCDPRSRGVLAQLITELRNIRDTVSDAEWTWGIKEDYPFYTAVSFGGYQPNGEGAHNVFARITSTWSIQRVRPPGKKTAKAQKFVLTGNASTRVRLLQQATGDTPEMELAMWRAEVGASDSPGCHFHVQIAGESDTAPFPHSLDIPRLPALLVTPPAVVEYVLGELFQEEWHEHLATKGAELNRWWPIQRRRLGAVLLWQLKIIGDATGSPWTTLKRKKPAPDLFMLDQLPRLNVAAAR